MYVKPIVIRTVSPANFQKQSLMYVRPYNPVALSMDPANV